MSFWGFFEPPEAYGHGFGPFLNNICYLGIFWNRWRLMDTDSLRFLTNICHLLDFRTAGGFLTWIRSFLKSLCIILDCSNRLRLLDTDSFFFFVKSSKILFFSKILGMASPGVENVPTSRGSMLSLFRGSTT